MDRLPATDVSHLKILKDRIRTVPDFPDAGSLFRDITPLLGDSEALALAVGALAEPYEASDVTCVAGMEARGFILGALVAQSLKVGFVPLRKAGKLPHKVLSVSYELEYGNATLEMHNDAISEHDRVLLVDDLIATGGTARASCRLIELAGGPVAGCAFLIELVELNGRSYLHSHHVHSILHY